jgi:hypothetical protein
MTREQEVAELTDSLLRHVARAHPDVSIADLMSAVFTILRSLISVTLEHQNDDHNRAEVVKCLGTLEADVWAKTPKEQIN